MCAAPEIEERVDRLEAILGQFMVQTNTVINRMERDTRLLKQEMREFKGEMREFKNEMLEFKDEMLEFKNEMLEFKDEMLEFKNEMKEFKDEMLEFKNEMKEFKDEMLEFKNEMKEFKDEMLEFKDEMLEFKDDSLKNRKEMNIQWGNLANRLGTLVEDIISPAVRPVVTKYFDCDITLFLVNVNKKDKNLNLKGEFDVIAVSDDYVFLVEAKSNPKAEYLYEFIENIQRFRKLFPEYGSKRLIPIFASLRFDEKMIQLATDEKIYILAYREWEYMDFLNFDKLAQVSVSEEAS